MRHFIFHITRDATNSVALVWRTRLEFTMAAAHRSLRVDLRRSVQ